jgi:hypothetical protein
MGNALPSERASLSSEVESVFRYLGLDEFSDCPEFDFQRCHWRFTEFENRGHSVFDSNTEFAHGSFDAHATNFSPGIEQLLLAQATVEPFGMAILPMPVEQVHTKELWGITGMYRQSRRPEWRRKAKQRDASLPMRSRPSSAISATSPIVSEHRLASSFDLRLPQACSIGLMSGA